MTPFGLLRWLVLVPAFSQRCTLRFAEHLPQEVLLNLAHRQLVFAMPKRLRVFFRHGRRLFANVSRLISRIIHDILPPDR